MTVRSTYVAVGWMIVFIVATTVRAVNAGAPMAAAILIALVPAGLLLLVARSRARKGRAGDE